MKVRAVINKSKKDKGGLCPIKLRVSGDGTRKEIYLPGVKIDPKLWDASKQSVKNDKMLTLRIQNQINKYKEQINKQEALDSPIAPEEVHSLIQNKSSKINGQDLNAVEYCKNHFVIDLNLSYGTRKGYSSFAKILKEYDAKISLDRIDLNWIAGFKEYLVKKHKINPYTMSCRLKTVRRLVRHAYEAGKLSKYPLEGLKIAQAKANRQFLSITQLRQLLAYTPKLNLQNTYNAFVFSCYTGLRFGDLATIKYSNLSIDNSSGEDEIVLFFTMGKTKRQVRIHLNKSISNLIDRNKIALDEPIFSFLKATDFDLSSDKLAMKIESANALANKRLKEIMKDADLPEGYSFHCARHTFACVALQLGVDLMSLRDLIGHTDLKVTQEYLKVIDSQKKNAIEKFNSI